MGSHESQYKGVYISTTSATSLTTFAKKATEPRLIFNGKHPGCFEARKGLDGICEFDGQFRVARWQGMFHVFGRANTPERHVQVVSTSDWNSWSDFRLITISNVDYHNQIYFLHA